MTSSNTVRLTVSPILVFDWPALVRAFELGLKVDRVVQAAHGPHKVSGPGFPPSRERMCPGKMLTAAKKFEKIVSISCSIHFLRFLLDMEW